jgi:predicted transcriptional regulator
MSHPGIVIASDEVIEVAGQPLQEQKIGRLPVVDHGTLIGIVSRSDLLRGFALRREGRASLPVNCSLEKHA